MTNAVIIPTAYNASVFTIIRKYLMALMTGLLSLLFVCNLVFVDSASMGKKTSISVPLKLQIFVRCRKGFKLWSPFLIEYYQRKGSISSENTNTNTSGNRWQSHLPLAYHDVMEIFLLRNVD